MPLALGQAGGSRVQTGCLGGERGMGLELGHWGSFLTPALALLPACAFGGTCFPGTMPQFPSFLAGVCEAPGVLLAGFPSWINPLQENPVLQCRWPCQQEAGGVGCQPPGNSPRFIPFSLLSPKSCHTSTGLLADRWLCS